MSARFLVPLILASATKAFSAPPPGTSHDPPRYVDEADLYFTLWNGDGGYKFRVHARVFGVGDNADAVRIDYTQGGKTVAQQRCKLAREGTDQGVMRCDYEGKLLTTTGNIVANLIYVDDQDGKEYLLRTLKGKVATYYWQKKKSYQLVPDDLLGSAIAWHRTTADELHRGEHELKFYFWAARGFGGTEAKLRCSVDGKRQPDVEVFLSAGSENIEMEDDSTGKDVRYKWSPMTLEIRHLYFGTKEEAEAARHHPFADGERALADLPGAWDCDLRLDGAVIRQFKFAVSDKGRILSQWQPTQGMLMPSEAYLHITLPKTPWDDRVRPDAIRAGFAYGMAWPSDAAIKSQLKLLPGASGFPEPGAGGHK
jgi:hypothetical protein